MAKFFCNICVEEKPNKVTCSCDFEACKDCIKQYLLGSTKHAHCMSCKTGWGQKFLIDNFTKGWVEGNKEGQYRAHQKALALDREKSRVPETLAELPRLKAQKEAIESSQKIIKELYARRKELKKELAEINRLIPEAQRQASRAMKKELQEIKAPNFICPCPDEECRGMIDSVKFRCGVCGKKICRKCREFKAREDGEKHECNKDVLENVKFLRQDTKPCPKCATAIHKIDGCDQMWCTQCRTPFSWRTGEIETGTIHNPHAIRWRRENGLNVIDVNDIPCGGLVQMYHIINIPREKQFYIERIHRVIAEINNYIYRENNDFGGLRMRYILKEISEDKWMQSIFVKERQNERKRANNEILTTLRTLAIERFRDLAQTLQELPSENFSKCNRVVEKFIKEMGKIRNFINKAFMEELPPLGTKKPLQIVSCWMWSDRYERYSEKQRMQFDNF